jgi:hypothetical protein
MTDMSAYMFANNRRKELIILTIFTLLSGKPHLKCGSAR